MYNDSTPSPSNYSPGVNSTKKFCELCINARYLNVIQTLVAEVSDTGALSLGHNQFDK